nr:aldo/keto reductase [Longispora albida]
MRPFGRTGVQVSPLTLGVMNFNLANEAEGVRVIHRALDAGITVIDTADVYSRGESEQVVAKALTGGKRADVFLATKVHGHMSDNPNHRGNSRRWITRAIEDSLRRLGTDHVDLYQIHRPDPHTDIDETLGALTDLVRQGKIRYFGTSTFSGAELVEAQWAAEKRGRERPASEQPPYSILARGIEREVLPVAQRYDLAVLPWSPLAGGWLSGNFGQSHRAATSRFPARYDASLPANAPKAVAVAALEELAKDAGLSLIQLALGFVLAHPAVTSAIIGPRTLEQLEGQLDTVELSGDVLDRIDEIVPPGVTLNKADAGYEPPSIAEAALRRR